jgi:hypothetical protein
MEQNKYMLHIKVVFFSSHVVRKALFRRFENTYMYIEKFLNFLKIRVQFQAELDQNVKNLSLGSLQGPRLYIYIVSEVLTKTSL